jgi:MtN3 and saliva related transmembrane protein
MDWIEATGLLAAFCTTISLLPQAMKIIRTRNTAGISLTMYSIFTFGIVAWLVYGLARQIVPIIVANVVSLILSTIILALKIRHK